jgi:hypothetical protein
MNHQLVKDINILIKKYHNPSIVNFSLSPNANRIYHIYSNGQITNQKGSYAYLLRSEFIDKYTFLYKNYNLDFPLKNSDNEYYAIVEETHANEIRNLMLKLK